MGVEVDILVSHLDSGRDECGGQRGAPRRLLNSQVAAGRVETLCDQTPAPREPTAAAVQYSGDLVLSWRGSYRLVGPERQRVGF